MKLYNSNLSKIEYIDLLLLVNFYDFCLEKTNLLFWSAWVFFLTLSGYIHPEVFDY